MFWFALLSTITPPVCGAVYIAAGMAQENWLRVAMTSMTIGLGLYLIPLGMIAWPNLIRLSENPVGAVTAAVMVGLGCVIISYGLISLRQPLRVGLTVLAGLAVIFLLPGVI